MHWFRWGFVAVLAMGCSNREAIGAASESVVYGEDDRIEVFEADVSLRMLVDRSVVSLVEGHRVDVSDSADVELSAPTLQEFFQLCDGERFADQLAPAQCSGVLIDDDLVLTAGHCFSSGVCSRLRFVFRHYYRAAGELETINRQADIYDCREVIVHRLDSERDYAIVKLDRPVASLHAPVAIAAAEVSLGDALTLTGAGAGLPIKVDSGGEVQSVGDTDFRATVDAFGGHSGAPVLTADAELAGILVSGATDFAPAGGCFVVNTLGSDSTGEQLMKASGAIDALCAEDWPSELCGDEAACGDGVCSGTETSVSCNDDCDPPFCGDQVCDLGEDTGAMVCSDCDFSRASCSVGDSDSGTFAALLALVAYSMRRRQATRH